jgi:hypothetical protein
MPFLRIGIQMPRKITVNNLSGNKRAHLFTVNNLSSNKRAHLQPQLERQSENTETDVITRETNAGVDAVKLLACMQRMHYFSRSLSMFMQVYKEQNK